MSDILHKINNSIVAKQGRMISFVTENATAQVKDSKTIQTTDIEYWQNLYTNRFKQQC